MSLYIPGCDLPKEGNKLLVIFPDGVVNEVERGTPYYEAKQLSPHGRLGDLDEMAVDESEAYMSAQLKLGDDVITKSINEAVHTKIVRLIADTPTIIPADPEGGADNG